VEPVLERLHLRERSPEPLFRLEALELGAMAWKRPSRVRFEMRALLISSSVW